MIQKTAIISLLQKYIERKCTEEELRILFHWLQSDDCNLDLDIVTRLLWKSIDKTADNRSPKKEKELHREAIRLLHEMKVRKDENRATNIVHRNILPVFYRIAAILLLVISVTFGLWKISDRSIQKVAYTEKISKSGEKDSLLLADGTKIILNANTRIRIPSDFNKKSRIIEMEGEGFFDVSPNPEKPFTIQSGGANVQVVGTSFDFKSYAEDDFITLTVSTGKVRVNMPEQDLQLAVSPNEHLSVNKIDGNVRKTKIEDNNYIKWMQGSLYFNREPIREVIKTINRTYNRNVVLKCGTDCNYHITGTHDNKSLEAVIEAICFTTGLNCRIEGESIILYE